MRRVFARYFHVGNHAYVWPFLILLVIISATVTWRFFVMNWSSYWDFVPPPYGWGMSPIGWTENLLGETVWVNGTYWLWPLWLLSPSAVTKGLLVVPAFLAPLTFFVLARRLGVHSVAATLGGLYYLLNPSLHTRYLQGHTGDLLGYASAPLLGLAVWHLLDSSRRSRSVAVVAAGVILFLGASLKPHWLVLQVLVLLPFVVALFVVRERRVLDTQTAVHLLAVVLLGLLLDLPLLVIALTVGIGILQRLHSVVHLAALSSDVHWLTVIRLAGEPAVGLLPNLGYYRLDLRGILGFIPAGITLGSPFISARSSQRLAVIAVVSWVVVAFLSTGITYSPWPYLWFYAHLPFFTAFRESSKFLMVGALISSLAISVGIDGVLRRSLWLGATLSLGIALAIVGYAWPMFSGDMRISATRIYQPTQGALGVGHWLDRQPGQFRVMVIPHDDETFHIWPLVSRRPLFGVDNDRVLGSLPSVYAALRVADAGRLGDDKSFAEGLARAGVQFVVVRRGEDTSSFRFTSPAATIAANLGQRLLGTSGRFHKVLETRGYVVYRDLLFSGWVSIEKRAMAGEFSCSPDEARRPTTQIVVRNLGEWVDPSEVNAALNQRWITGPSYEWVYPGPYARGETTHSRWYAITSGKSPLAQWFVTPESGSYRIRLRGFLSDGATAPEILVNERQLMPATAWPRNHFGDVAYEFLYLKAGRNHLKVQGQGGIVAIDTVTFELAARNDPFDSSRPKTMLGSLPSYRAPKSQWSGLQAHLAYKRLFGGLYVLRLRGAPPGVVTIAEASQPGWVILGAGTRAEVVPCKDALLHVWTHGGNGTIVVGNRFAMLITAAWVTSAVFFSAAIVYLAFSTFLVRIRGLTNIRMT
jgi:hypothetical protein